MTVGHLGVSEFNPTIQLTQMPSVSKVKVNAPSFDGLLDPQVYINWQLLWTSTFVGMTCSCLEKFNLS